MVNPAYDSKRRLVRLLAGDECYIKLIVRLPDAFYYLDFDQEGQAWDRIYHAVTNGERSPDRLAQIGMREQ